jgi:hypothetical protein
MVMAAMGALGGGDALEIVVALKDLTTIGFAKVRSEITATEAKANSTNLSGFSKSANAAEADAAKLAGKAGGGGIGGLGSSFGGLVSPAGLAIGAITAVVVAGDEAAKKYQAHQVAVDGLTTALNQNVPAWKSQQGAIDAAVESSTKLGFTDTETVTAMTGLVAATGDVTKATQILSAAQDLARFKKISLQDATEALTKVEAGSYRILKSLGIELPKNATQTEALAAVQKLAGGQAQTYANSDLGAVAIASAKVDDAQEKMGAGFSKLEAVILPAVADAVGTVGDEFDALGKTFDKTVPPATKLNSIVAVFNDLGGKNIPIVGGMIGQLNDVADAETAAAAAALTHGDELDALRTSVVGLTDSESLHNDVALETADDIAKIARVADIAAAAIPQLSNAIGDELFGKAITAGHIQQLKDANKELEKQRDQVKLNSPKWIELTGQIADNNKSLMTLQLTQAEAQGPKAAIAYLEKLKAKYGDADGSIMRLITDEKAQIPVAGALLQQLTKIGSFSAKFSGKTIPLFAAGGQYAANMPRIVGEDGPELDIPDHSGTIVPKSGWGQFATPALLPASTGRGGGGATSTIVHTHIYLDGRQIAEVVDTHRYRSDALAPTSTRGY